MREFFRGWKRKIGVVTLFMALMFIGLWVRGFAVTDLYEFGIGHGKTCDTLVLSQHGLMWMRLEVFGFAGMSWGPGWTTEDPSTRLYFDPRRDKSPPDIEWQWSLCGFDFCQLSHGTSERYTHRNVPYWSVVLPLTLISAWCLLTKPRTIPATQAEPSHA